MSNSTASIPKQCVDRLMESDRLILAMLGIKLIEVREGQVALSMQVTPSMVNSQNFCHGGFIFTLADSAGAYAAASTNSNPATTESNISFVSAARLGDMLRAVATVESHSKKVIYSCVQVTNQDSEVVALYRGSNVNRGPCIMESHLLNT